MEAVIYKGKGWKRALRTLHKMAKKLGNTALYDIEIAPSSVVLN